MIIRAKYGSSCHRCGGPILPGQWMDWKKHNPQCDRHAACQTEQEKAIAPFDHEQGRYVSPEALEPAHER